MTTTLISSRGPTWSPLARRALGLAAVAVLSACASRPDKVAGDTPGSANTVITGATLMTEGESPRLLLTGSAPLAPTVYSRDGSKRIVVDVANAVAAAGLEPPRADGVLLSRVDMKSFTELGHPHVQFELTSRTPLEARIPNDATSSAAMAIHFSRVAGPAETMAASSPPSPLEAATAVSEPVVRSESLDTKTASRSDVRPADVRPADVRPVPPTVPAKSQPASEVVTVASIATDPPAPVHHASSGRPATRLHAVSARPAAGDVVVTLSGDGAFTYETFALANPPRWVVDLPGVRNTAAARQQDVQKGSVSRIRVSQFKGGTEPVTRVVFDVVDGAAVPAVEAGPKGLAVVFRGRGVRPASPATTTAASTKGWRPAAGTYEKHEIEDTHETVVRDAPAPATASNPSALGSVSAGAVAPASSSASGSQTSPTVSSPALSAPRPEPVKVAEAPVPSAPATVSAAPMSRPQTTDRIEAAPQIVASSPEIRLPLSKPPPASKPRKKAGNGEDRALIEAAEALLLQQDTTARSRDLTNPYEARTLGAGEKQYTGEPITLNLKDADIKDTLQRFSELTQLNIVLDPDVRGTVTVSLTDIPWDQALELILKINGLGYVLEGNVMRIATTRKLADEEVQKQAFSKAQDQNRPVKTVLQKISYANASAIAAVAKRVMSARGDIFIDAHSNTLIIKELPDYLPTVLDLIKNLDVPDPQVMIETRIVEATRTFSNEIGVIWNFNGAADAAHGNTTGLVFPNSVGIDGAVSVPSGAPQVLHLALANVLDTFRLDMSLHAAESRGLVKVISTPKVQTQTGEQASIQSGFQIPVQTTVNNTTTVLYINATLRLEVTPFITNEGTIIMEINIQKREPAVGINIAGGQNIPLTTRDAKTRLMVRDGGTAVIGGIFKLTSNDGQSMIPGLWKIPILGNLFRSRTKTENTDELMIFITPRIIR